MADINITLTIDDGLDVLVEVGTCVDHFIDLLDGPGVITANQYVKGNAGGTALEFGTLPSQVSGLDTQIQYNDGGAFAGDAENTWNNATNTQRIGSNSTDGTLDITGKAYCDQETTTFANPVSVDCNKSNNHRIAITGDTTINLTNHVAGMNGVIVLYNTTGGHTVVLGAAFTKELNGSDTYDATVSKYNLIAWYYDGVNVLYSITNEA